MAGRGMDLVALRRGLAAGRIDPVYLVFGDEAFLKEEAAQLIREAVLGSDAEAASWNLTLLEGGSCSVTDILDAARSLPMFSSRRLVWVKDAERLRESEPKALREYLQAPSPSACILLTVGSGKPDFRKAVFKALQGGAKTLEFAPLKGAALARWIQSRAKDLGAEMGEDASSLLELHAGPDLLRLDQELRKAMDFIAPSTRLTSEALSETLGSAAAGSIFEFAERAGAGECEEAIGLLRGILSEGEEPPRLLFLLARHLRTLVLGRSLSSSGRQGRELALALGIPPYPFLIEKVQRQIRAFPEKAGKPAFRLILRADRALKSGNGKPPGVLERLVLDLSRVVNEAAGSRGVAR
jgi:DNA polymerase III subunit delta